MRLPIPVEVGEEIYTDVEIKKPTSGVLAEVHKQKDDLYRATRVMCGGCITSFKTKSEKIIDGDVQLKRLVSELPYRSAELIILNIALLVQPGLDMIEGLYQCPRCNYQILSELSEDDGMTIDTRDSLNNIPVSYLDHPEEIFIQLSEPTIFDNIQTGEVLQEVTNFSLKHPTLTHCSNAQAKYGSSDPIQMQFGIYVEALTKVNGQPVDNKWKSNFGDLLFNNIEDPNDLAELSDQIRKYGKSSYVEKLCPKCNKKFKTPYNTSSFFGFALVDQK